MNPAEVQGRCCGSETGQRGSTGLTSIDSEDDSTRRAAESLCECSREGVISSRSLAQFKFPPQCRGNGRHGGDDDDEDEEE